MKNHSTLGFQMEAVKARLEVEYRNTYGRQDIRRAAQIVISDCASREARYGQRFHWVPGDREICCFSPDFVKNILTENQKSVNLSSPARTGQSKHCNTTNMNPKLLFTILAAAFTQMANACSGTAPDPAPEKPAGRKATTKAAPEPEPEEEPDLTLNVDDDDAEELEAARKAAKKTVAELFKADEDNKPKVQSLMKKHGGLPIGDMDLATVKKFHKALKALE